MSYEKLFKFYSNWDGFFKDYPNSNGLISFTRIAFNGDKSQALFEVGRSYGSLGGEGSIVYLKKLDGEWTIIDILPTWIS